MLITHSHPWLRRVEWVSDLVLALREPGGARWVLTPDRVARLDGIGLRWFVACGHWPARFGEPAALWIADAGCELAVSRDGRQWRRLEPVRGTLDPAAVDETGPVIDRRLPLPCTPDSPDRWLALLTPAGPAIVAAEFTTLVLDEPEAIPAAG